MTSFPHCGIICKALRPSDNHNGVITHLEPDILECEVKWALESITTAFSGKQPELTLENGALFTRPRKPHKIMQIKRFKSSCSL